jgi:hypothetical protein
MAQYKVIWEPNPGPQTELLRCPVFEVFYGGARGGGKTDGVLGDWASHSAKYGKHANGILIRRELTQLRDLIARSKEIYGRLRGASYSSQDKTWVMPGGARLTFAYLENDADADRYHGYSLTRVYVEEIGNFPDPAPIFKLMATLRSAHGVPVGFRATGNPGGVGQSWIKARYVDPAPRGGKLLISEFINPFTGEKQTKERVFIPSLVTDNPYLGDDYVATLQLSGSEKLVKAWLAGDWSQVEGAFFDNFDVAKHVIDPFPLSPNWLRFRAMDWGSAKPFAVGWFTVVGDDQYILNAGRKMILPRGSLIMYREWYGNAPGKHNVGLKLDAEEVATGILALESKDPKITYGVLDPSAFSRDGGPSIEERMSDLKVRFDPAVNRRKDTPDGRMGGWNMLYHRLNGEHGHPMIYFFSTCVHTIRTLPELQHDAKEPEDLDTEAEDHCADMVRYACMSRPWIKKPTLMPDQELEKSAEIASKGYYAPVVGEDDKIMVNMEKLFEKQERRRSFRLDRL